MYKWTRRSLTTATKPPHAPRTHARQSVLALDVFVVFLPILSFFPLSPSAPCLVVLMAADGGHAR